MIADSGPAASTIIAECKAPLIALCRRPYVTVRVLARRLLASVGVEVAPPPANDASESLRNAVADGCDGGADGSGEAVRSVDAAPRAWGPASARGVVERFAGGRLRVGRLGTIMRRPVEEVVASGLDVERMKAQVNAYSSRADPRVPDAFLDDAQTVEAAMQTVAAGLRAALAANGEVVGDAVRLEDNVAAQILNDPAYPKEMEMAREPRPAFPRPPGKQTEVWQRLRSGSSESMDTHPVSGTVQVHGAAQAPVVLAGEFRGWRVVARAEDKVFEPRSGSQEKPTHVSVYQITMGTRTMSFRTRPTRERTS